ncbi:response regulator transcription factor [Nocardia concava]|uniref:response regulator transcription factor n=1 Tax=Nocardia concava TaxID=257281 RepID=UPI0002E31B04|nr:response regulator transcription factor [Nocardia concava]
MRLAVVEDDDGVGDALVEAFGVRGHAAVRMRRGADLLTCHRGFDAVVLDLGLPDADGLTVLRQLREVSTVPVVILTARSDERSIVRGLRGGADDYVIKPPRIAELLARLENVTRRPQPVAAAPARTVVTGDVTVDLDARRVSVAGVEIALTTKEFELVEALTERPGAAVSRQQLMDRIWGDAFVAVSRSLDVHMTGLRAKLDRPGLITTIRGYGYRWGD